LFKCIFNNAFSVSDDYDDVEVELFRLPYFSLTFSYKNIVRIDRSKAYPEKLKYDRIFNEL